MLVKPELSFVSFDVVVHVPYSFGLERLNNMSKVDTAAPSSCNRGSSARPDRALRGRR